MRFSRLTCKLASSGYRNQLMCRTHDNAKFASCGGDKVVFIWDVPSGKVLRRLSGHFGKINALAFNTDAQILASGMFTITNEAEY
jgi:mitogen-activated protein kinase organizer 1